MLLVGRQEGHPTCKKTVVGCWRGYLSGARRRLAYGPADVTVSFFSKIHIGVTFLVPAHLGSPGQRAVKRVCVCVFVYKLLFLFNIAYRFVSKMRSSVLSNCFYCSLFPLVFFHYLGHLLMHFVPCCTLPDCCRLHIVHVAFVF